MHSTLSFVTTARIDLSFICYRTPYLYIAQADARAVALAKRRVRLEARVLAKFQKHGLASLTTDDVTIILKQAYRVGGVVSLEGCNAAWNGGTLDWS